MYRYWKQAKDGTLPNQKVDWLRVVVEEIEAQGEHVHNGIMKVRDPTGIAIIYNSYYYGNIILLIVAINAYVQEKSHALFIKM